MVAWLGPAISAAGTLLGGIMGNKAAEKQNMQQTRAIERANKQAMKREDTRIQRTVEDARAAGIHPLAALGSSVVGNMAVPQAAFGGAPISGSAVGDAVSQLGAGFGSTQSELQEQLLRAQIRNVDASTAQLLADASSRSRIQNAQMQGSGFLVPSVLPDAERAEQRYGEISDYTFGPQVFWSDVKETYKDKGIKETLVKLDAGGVLRDLLPYTGFGPLLAGKWFR